MDNLILDRFEQELEESLGLFPAPQPFVSDLRRKVMHPAKRPTFRFRRAFRWAPLVIGIILAIVVFAVGPERIVSAMRQWLGLYFPGIGFVEHSSLRVLEKPVSVKVDGAEAEIRWAYSNDQHMVIGFPVTTDTRPCKEWKVYSRETSALFYQMSLRRVFLPDGQEIKITPNGDYPPLPPSVDQITVRVATSKETPGCPADRSCRCMDADQMLDIPLKFVTPLPQEGLEIYDLQFTPLPDSQKNNP